MKTEPEQNERAFSFIIVNHRQQKPRAAGIAEIRGPYYTPVGKHHLEDVFDTM